MNINLIYYSKVRFINGTPEERNINAITFVYIMPFPRYRQFRKRSFLNRSKTKSHRLTEGEQGHIYKVGDKIVKIIKPKSRIGRLFAAETFFEHKIAHLLFPENILEYTDFDIDRKKRFSIRPMQGYLESEPIETSEEHKKYVSKYYAKKFKNIIYDKDIIKHKNYVRNLEASKLVNDMHYLGIYPNTHPVNVDKVHSRPFFFEVNVDPIILKFKLGKIEQIYGKEIREIVEEYLENLEYTRGKM